MPEQQINPRTNWPTLATRDHHMRAHDNSSSKRKTDKKSQPNVYPIYPLWCWSLMCGGAAGPVPDRLVCLLERGGPVHRFLWTRARVNKCYQARIQAHHQITGPRRRQQRCGLTCKNKIPDVISTPTPPQIRSLSSATQGRNLRGCRGRNYLF